MALIAGPTASGKSALALALAQSLAQAGRDAVIINADASQVYAGLPIVTAQPDAAEQARAPHMLFGHIPPSEACNAARWAVDAAQAIASVHAAGALPILVGGTGLYLRVLLDGIAPIPDIPDGLRAAVRALPVAEAHARLRMLDPASAVRLHPTDSTRVARALEVVEATGRNITDWHAHKTGGIGDAVRLTPLCLLPPREWLRARCSERLAVMLRAGAVAEVAALLALDLPPDLPAMRAIGVSDIAAMLAGTIDEATMIARATAATHQYAKRQYNWFRHQVPADWPAEGEQFNNADVGKLAIKLREKLLTD